MSWKRIFAGFLAVTFLFSGCGYEKTVTSSISQEQMPPLRIFCPAEEYTDISDALAAWRSEYPQITVDLVRFDSMKEMEDQLVGQLNTNSGPDVVILNHSTGLNVRKMAQSGAFVALDSYLQADDTYQLEHYLPAAMDCCRFDEKQYLLPVGFVVMLNEHRGQTVQEMEIIQGKTSLDEYYAMLASHEKIHQDEPGTITFFRRWIDYMDGIGFPVISQVLAMFGVDPGMMTDSNQSQERVHRAVDWIGLIRRQDEKLRSALDEELEYDQTFTYSYSSHDSVMTYFIRRITDQNLYNDKTLSYFIPPSADDPEKLTGMLALFGAVTKDAAYPQEAYDFLRLVMDHYYNVIQPATNPMWYTPVCRENVLSSIDHFSSQTHTTKSGEIIPPLTEEEGSFLLGCYDAIESISIPNPKMAAFLESEFIPYWDGEADFEACYQRFLRKLTLYQEE